MRLQWPANVVIFRELLLLFYEKKSYLLQKLNWRTCSMLVSFLFRCFLFLFGSVLNKVFRHQRYDDCAAWRYFNVYLLTQTLNLFYSDENFTSTN